MPRGDKSAYTSRQKRKAHHIEEGYEKHGVSKGESERRAWATVNAEDGGGKRKKSKKKNTKRARTKKGASKRTVRKRKRKTS